MCPKQTKIYICISVGKLADLVFVILRWVTWGWRWHVSIGKTFLFHWFGLWFESMAIHDTILEEAYLIEAKKLLQNKRVGDHSVSCRDRPLKKKQVILAIQGTYITFPRTLVWVLIDSKGSVPTLNSLLLAPKNTLLTLIHTPCAPCWLHFSFSDLFQTICTIFN